jgi:hypothetical protein
MEEVMMVGILHTTVTRHYNGQRYRINALKTRNGGIYICAQDIKAMEMALTDAVLAKMKEDITSCGMWDIVTFQEFTAAVADGSDFRLWGFVFYNNNSIYLNFYSIQQFVNFIVNTTRKHYDLRGLVERIIMYMESLPSCAQNTAACRSIRDMERKFEQVRDQCQCEKGVALFMSQHARLGAQSPLQRLHAPVLEMIYHMSSDAIYTEH